MLYICPTPIGNLEDITIRTLNILNEVDLICCEDTRHSLKLLNHFNIKSKLISLHEHNEKQRVDYIIDILKSGENIALISDAGMPGISDPGALVIRSVMEENLDYTVLPGASAAIVAAVGSTLASDGFLFLGFLPRKSKDRLAFLDKYKHVDKALIFYESPHRIKEMVQDLLKVFNGNRKVALVREISKRYEEYCIL
ncbi:MAG: 16S rRNA (cytidine(1402)-2'-O)-methyltransferase, partial [Filifactoraceae bacterium]